MKQAVYLDYAAATPIDAAVFSAMKPFFIEDFYNPSGLYQGGRYAKQALEQARSDVASSIGARPSEIIFTSGGSESTNLAIKGIMDRYPDGELLISAVEHDAVRHPAAHYKTSYIGVDEKGVVMTSELEKLITAQTVLISVMYANNEVGTVQPIEEVVAIVALIRKERRQQGNHMPIYVHTDAAQAPLYLDVNVARLGVDLMSLNGGKIYGPKQSGILYRRSGIELQPVIEGGGQEFGMRSGTENVAACVGFATALSLAVQGRQHTTRHMKELHEYFIKKLDSFSNVVVNGHPKKRLPNNIHVTFMGADNERMLFSLDDQNVYAATGSACSASSEEASHVLKAMGFDDDYAHASLRFTMGNATTKASIDRAIDALKVALKA